MRAFPTAMRAAMTAASMLACAHCGGSAGDSQGTQPVDGGAHAGLDGQASGDDAADVPDTTPVGPGGYPAAHAPIPLMKDGTGPILASPKIVTVTFQGDTLHTRLEELGDALGATAWWSSVASEYGVGAATGGVHVVIPTAAAATYADTEDPSGASGINDLIQARVADGTFPAPTADTLYVLYFPQGTTITLDALTSCIQGGFGGYHKSVPVSPPGGGAPIEVAYAIVPRCPDQTTMKYTEAATTSYASHEIIEAATDAKPIAQGVGWMMTDELWRAALGGEVADLCVDVTGGDASRIVEGGFAFQRSWSNDSVRAGHNPCVPVPPGEVYFNTATAPGKEAVSLAVGGSTTIELDAFSDAPRGPWTLQALDIGAQLSGTTSSLALTLDKNSASNGDKLQLTVKLLSKPPALPPQFPPNAAFYAIASIDSASRIVHLWPAKVQAK